MLLFYKQFVKQPIENWQDIYQIQPLLPEKVKLVTWSFMEMYWLIPFLSAFNGDLLVDNHVQLNTPAMKSALKFVWDLNKQNLVDRQCDYTSQIMHLGRSKLSLPLMVHGHGKRMKRH